MQKHDYFFYCLNIWYKLYSEKATIRKFVGHILINKEETKKLKNGYQMRYYIHRKFWENQSFRTTPAFLNSCSCFSVFRYPRHFIRVFQIATYVTFM